MASKQMNLPGITEWINERTDLSEKSKKDYRSAIVKLLNELGNKPVSTTKIIKVIKQKTIGIQKTILQVLVKFKPNSKYYRKHFDETIKQYRKQPIKAFVVPEGLQEAVSKLPDDNYGILFKLMAMDESRAVVRMSDYRSLRVSGYDSDTDNFITDRIIKFNTLVKTGGAITIEITKELQGTVKTLLDTLQKTKETLLFPVTDNVFTKRTGKIAKELGVGTPSKFRKLFYHTENGKNLIKAHDELQEIAKNHNHSIQTARDVYAK